MNDLEDEIQRDHETATAELRNLIDDRLTVAAISLNPRDRQHLAEVLLPLLTPSWEYGVRYNPDKDDIFLCDDQDHAAQWKRDAHWDGPVVRRLAARLVRQEWTEVQR